MGVRVGKGKTCWILVGGRNRLGREIAERLAVSLTPDESLVLTSSRSWKDEGRWLEPLSNFEQTRTFQWDAQAPELLSTMMADMDALGEAGIAPRHVVIFAGSFPEQPFGAWTSEALAATWGLNLSFPMLVAQAVAPRLCEGGCLHFILDTAIHRPFLKRLPYSAAKAALAALVPGLARALAPRVRVVGHALGTALPTEGFDDAVLAERSLLNRNGTPDDVFRALRYAADSPYLTGEILTLDGGMRWA